MKFKSKVLSLLLTFSVLLMSAADYAVAPCGGPACGAPH